MGDSAHWAVLVVAVVLSGCGPKLDTKIVPRLVVEGHPDRFVEAYRERIDAVVPRTESWEAVGELALFYHANGYLEEALPLYAVLESEDPKAMRWPYLASRIEQDYGRSEKALSSLERAIDRDPDSGLLRLRSGELLLKMGKPQAAELAYDEALDRSPDMPFALIGKARIAMADSDWESASEGLRRVIDVEPGLSTSYMLLAAVLENIGQFEEAEEVRNEGIRRDQAVRFEDPWLDDLDEHCYDVYRLRVRADMLSMSGDWEGGLRLLQRALLIDESDAQTHFDLAKIYRDTDLSATLERLSTTVALEPKLEAAWHMWVAVLLENSRYENAMEVSRQALAALPASAALVRQRGVLLEAVKELQVAEILYRRAVELEPNDAENHETLGNYLWARNRKTEATQSYEKVLKLSPLAAKPRAMLAVYALEQDRIDEALAWILEAEKADPGLEGIATLKADILLRKANRLARSGKIAEAEVCYLESFLADRGQAQALSNYAALLSQGGRTSELRRRLVELRDEYPATAILLYFSAQLAAMEKHFSEAAQLTEEGLAIAQRTKDAAAYRLLSALSRKLAANR